MPAVAWHALMFHHFVTCKQDISKHMYVCFFTINYDSISQLKQIGTLGYNLHLSTHLLVYATEVNLEGLSYVRT